MIEAQHEKSAHTYSVVSYDVLHTLQKLAQLQSYNFKPTYNLFRADHLDLHLCKWDGKTFNKELYHLQPLDTYTAYSVVFGNRDYDRSFIYIGENHFYQSNEEKELAQQERNELEEKMRLAGKSVKHRVLGERSPLHGFPNHASHIMRSLPETIVLADWYAKSSYQNIYITPSAWVAPLHYDHTGKERQRKDLASFQVLVVDLDCDLLHFHPSLTTNKMVMNMLAEKLQVLLTVLFDEMYAGLPLPTILHDTGRGIQIWYVFNSVSAKAEALYQRLIDAVSLALNMAFTEYSEKLSINIWLDDEIKEMPAFSVDVAVLQRQITGWVRGFNSYNAATHTRTQAYQLYTGNRQTIQELIKRFESILDEQGITYKKIKKKSNTAKKSGGINYESESTGITKSTFIRRMDAVCWLISKRQGSGSTGGWRDLCLFHYYNSAVTVMPRDKAWDRTLLLNTKLTVPLDDSELHDIQRAVDSVKTGCYKYKTDTFLGSLSLTDAERAHIQGMLGASREQDRESKREKKQVRDALIETLATENNIKTIAEKTGVSIDTVTRKLRKAGLNPKETRNQKIMVLYKDGKTQKDIAKAVGVSEKTVSRVIKKGAKN